MRRISTICLTLLFAFAIATPAHATSVHFVPSKITKTVDVASGQVTIGYMVAGLGSRALGTVKIRGWVTVSATCWNGSDKTIKRFTEKQDRVATKSGYAGPDGNWSTTISLSPAKVCPPGSDLRSVSYVWGTLRMWVWEGGSAGSEAGAADRIDIDVYA